MERGCRLRWAVPSPTPSFSAISRQDAPHLGIVYVREGRTADALQTVDLAYAEAKKPNVSPSFISEVVQIGRSIAQATGDKDAIAKWSQRS